MLTYTMIYFAFLRKKHKDISDYAQLILCLIEMVCVYFLAGSGAKFWSTVSNVKALQNQKK